MWSELTDLQRAEYSYYIAFIILTALLVIYTMRTFYRTFKRSKIIARMNYNFDGSFSGGLGLPVTIDILNIGDKPLRKVTVNFNSGALGTSINETLAFIGPHELYKYAVGFIQDGYIYWFGNDKSTPLSVANDPKLFEVAVENNNVRVDYKGH